MVSILVKATRCKTEILSCDSPVEIGTFIGVGCARVVFGADDLISPEELKLFLFVVDLACAEV